MKRLFIKLARVKLARVPPKPIAATAMNGGTARRAEAVLRTEVSNDAGRRSKRQNKNAQRGAGAGLLATVTVHN
jgi:hypothetical protein